MSKKIAVFVKFQASLIYYEDVFMSYQDKLMFVIQRKGGDEIINIPIENIWFIKEENSET
jgi:hypothetical protein